MLVTLVLAMSYDPTYEVKSTVGLFAHMQTLVTSWAMGPYLRMQLMMSPETVQHTVTSLDAGSVSIMPSLGMIIRSWSSKTCLDDSLNLRGKQNK